MAFLAVRIPNSACLPPASLTPHGAASANVLSSINILLVGGEPAAAELRNYICAVCGDTRRSREGAPGERALLNENTITWNTPCSAVTFPFITFRGDCAGGRPVGIRHSDGPVSDKYRHGFDTLSQQDISAASVVGVPSKSN